MTPSKYGVNISGVQLSLKLRMAAAACACRDQPTSNVSRKDFHELLNYRFIPKPPATAE
jgi:hypothetical protein